MDRVDARFKIFKEKLKKLGYMKDSAKSIAQVMEKVADFGMMSDAGNKKVARAVSQSKTEAELRAKLEKISTMAKGKYAEASDDDVIQQAIQAMGSTAVGMQLRPDANVLVQLAGMEDLKKDGEIRTDDMKKTKVKWEDAVKVYKGLMSLKTPVRSKYLRILQKDAKSFKKVFDAVLKVSK